MAWVELRWSLPRSLSDLLSSKLFDAGALGVQEDFLPGEAPPPRQPWDTGPSAPLPGNVLLRAWWAAEDRHPAEKRVGSLRRQFPETLGMEWVDVV